MHGSTRVDACKRIDAEEHVMSAVVPPMNSAEFAKTPTAIELRLERLDAWCEKWSDRFNPILVKETRQALKSRQFVITFSLLLFAALSWTIVGTFSLIEACIAFGRGRDRLNGLNPVSTYLFIVTVLYAVLVGTLVRMDRTQRPLKTIFGKRSVDIQFARSACILKPMIRPIL